jgi:hypothetical protein
MKMRTFALRAVLAAAVGLTLVLSIASRMEQPVEDETLYTFTELGRLQQVHPGQTFLIRGFLAAYTTVGHKPVFDLTDTKQVMTGSQELDVAPGRANPLLDMLHHVPYLGLLVPASAAHPVTGHLATYRIGFVGCPKPTPCSSPPWELVSGG